MTYRVAGIQMASGPNVGANLTEARRLVSQAAAAGAGLVVLPENFAAMPLREADRLEHVEQDGKGPIQDFLSALARDLGIWLVGGTLPLATQDASRVRAACLVYDDKGQRVVRYDKLHLFDVQLDNGEKYNESSAIEAGDQVVVVDTPFGRLGLAVCYDLRFPELFRRMVDAGAEIFAIPSAFTEHTGKAHWDVLVRARAIENLSYVIAPGQGGYHVNGRETHGDSMIVDPWGVILDRLPRGSGVVIADVDSKRLEAVRKRLPSIGHRRLS